MANVTPFKPRDGRGRARDESNEVLRKRLLERQRRELDAIALNRARRLSTQRAAWLLRIGLASMSSLVVGGALTYWAVVGLGSSSLMRGVPSQQSSAEAVVPTGAAVGAASVAAASVAVTSAPVAVASEPGAAASVVVASAPAAVASAPVVALASAPVQSSASPRMPLVKPNELRSPEFKALSTPGPVPSPRVEAKVELRPSGVKSENSNPGIYEAALPLPRVKSPVKTAVTTVSKPVKSPESSSDSGGSQSLVVGVPADGLVLIQSGNTVLPVKVGDRLPNGEILTSADASTGKFETQKSNSALP